MKVFLFVFMFFCCEIFMFSQISSEIKNKVDKYPKKMASPGTLAALIDFDIEDDVDKVGAIYYWMANRIDFDVKDYFSNKKKYAYSFKYKTQDEKEKKIEKINFDIISSSFLNKKASSNGFAHLFKRLCNNVGVECVVIKGTMKNSLKFIGRKPGFINHWWNAVKLNDKWCLVDVALGSGSIDIKSEKFIRAYNEAYFLTLPDLFVLNHFPRDVEWLLVDKTKDDFANFPLFHTEYLNSDCQFSFPQAGVIADVKENKMEFAIQQDDVHQELSALPLITYRFMKDNHADTLKPVQKGNQFWFEVPLVSRKYDYLTIYSDNEEIVTYKVKISR